MSGNIFNKQGFGIPVINKDSENYLSLTAMCGDRVYKPEDAIQSFFSDKDVLRFIITRQITEDPGYLSRLKDLKVTKSDHSNHDLIGVYADQIIASHDKVTAEVLVNEYGIDGIHIKKDGSGNVQGVYAHHDIATRFAAWINSIFDVFMNKDYQRLKNKELDAMSKRGIKQKFVHHDARTAPSLENMRQRFSAELSAGEVHQCDDGYFRNTQAYIVLAPKFK